MAGRKRSRNPPQSAAAAAKDLPPTTTTTTTDKNTTGHNEGRRKNNKNPNKNNKKQKPSTAERENLDRWISNLATQHASANNESYSPQPSKLHPQQQEKQQLTMISRSSSSNSKAVRIEKRAAKQQRRQERKSSSGNNSKDQHESSSMVRNKSKTVIPQEEEQSPLVVQRQSRPIQQREGKSTSNTAAVVVRAGITTRKSKRRLKALCQRWHRIRTQFRKERHQVGKHGPHRVTPAPFRGYRNNGSHDGNHKRRHAAAKKKWDGTSIQPRPRDYGGLGLALPSLYLSLDDPSFRRRLEDEFREHVDGFFGKQRTKAMKKQLDGNMLWRRMSKFKQHQQGGGGDTNDNSNKRIMTVMKGKRFANMTPDQRVEAMLEAGLL